jgi:60 kDa SS-A/Ro ribonucleoprotein
MTLINENASQTQKLDSRQKMNGAGGFSFVVDDMDLLRRFLFLGSEASQYTAGRNAKITYASCPSVKRLLDQNGIRVVQELLDVSLAGRAAKQDPTLYVLAMASRHENVDVRKAAFAAVPKICRTPTMLFSYIDFYKAAGTSSGWGRLMRNAIAGWYNDKNLGSLIYQVTKYGQREGWSHQDVLRLSHPKPADADRSTFYKWISSGGKHEIDLAATSDKEAFNRLLAVEAAKLAPDVASVLPLIRDHKLVHENIPTNLQTSPEVWEAMLTHMPLGALIRNLGRMTSYGLLVNDSNAVNSVLEKFSNIKNIESARIHPFNVLTAYNTYKNGGSALSKLSWRPSTQVLAGLDKLFYDSFGFIEPSGKRTHIALDVSGSMDMGEILGSPGMKPRLGAAAMCMATLRTEESVTVSAFSRTLVACPLQKQDDLETVVRKMKSIPMGGTDCSVPIKEAMKAKAEIDTFIVYTDNETWAGSAHPVKALRDYREKMGIPSKLIVVGMNSGPFTIADPTDNGMLDVVGFDSATPAIIAEFSRGNI